MWRGWVGFGMLGRGLERVGERVLKPGKVPRDGIQGNEKFVERVFNEEETYLRCASFRVA